MSEEKVCRTCGISKIKSKDFYSFKGTYRCSCKSCLIKQNKEYQKKASKDRPKYANPKYSIDYYAKNKEKFAEYRAKFKEKFPTYRNDYMRVYNNKKRLEKKKALLESSTCSKTQ